MASSGRARHLGCSFTQKERPPSPKARSESLSYCKTGKRDSEATGDVGIKPACNAMAVSRASYYLYVILDIFSRYVVGWMVASREQGTLAKKLIEQSCEKQGIQPSQLIIHSDRGSSMTSKTVAFLLADLGITKSLSRPYVSNNNPYSEAQFKTMKYRPDFPERFGCFEDSRSFCKNFFDWYNTEHYHSGIGFLTPEDVHYGRTEQIIKDRQAVLSDAFAKHPGRFKGKVPKPMAPPEAAWINKPVPENSDPLRH
uniref:Integrase catalytic domain-containing protein n=1 Tax=uncultured Desulfobacterium sp. TaxID=201089 RepID=E1YEA7_9BACT|nr:hypothetical protein N47_B20120 [uncultured Desulfobacterium sp.]